MNGVFCRVDGWGGWVQGRVDTVEGGGQTGVTAESLNRLECFRYLPDYSTVGLPADRVGELLLVKYCYTWGGGLESGRSGCVPGREH